MDNMNKTIENEVIEDKIINNNTSSHYKLVIPLLMVLVFISIGFSYLSTGLKLNGGLGIPKMSWDVHFENIVNDIDNNVVPNIAATLDDTKTSVFFDVELQLPYDKYGFSVDIVNNGTLDAMLSGYTIRGISISQSEVLEHHFTYADGEELKPKDLLKAGESETVHFDVKYLNKLIDNDEIMSIVVTLDYIQADDTAVERE